MMDSMRRTIDADDDLPTDAPGIEPPPMISGDERRMHVRAYNFWAKLLEGRSFPSIESLDTEELGDFGPNSVLLDFTSGIENPAIAFVGPAIAREGNLDDSVQYINEVPRRSLLSRLTDHYLQIIANRAPIGFEAEFVNERGATIMYRGVLLPFSSDDDTIDFILGVINWKQVAEPSLVDSLNEEMTSLTPPHARPKVPVWADGPEATGENDDAELTQDTMLPNSLSDDGDDALLLDVITDDPDAVDIESALQEFRPGASVTEINDETAFASTGTTDDDSAGIASFDPEQATLYDWLALARESADDAEQAHVRGHAALYQAIGRAWEFACVAATAPDDYADMLDEAGIAVSERSPMTPVVKLVFGSGYDKTRIAEYASVLAHAAEQEVGSNELADYLARQPNGIKGLVRSIRSARKAAAPARDPMAAPVEALRRAVPLATLDLPYVEDDAEFSVMVARRLADGSHVIVALVPDGDPQVERTLKVAAKALKRRV